MNKQIVYAKSKYIGVNWLLFICGIPPGWGLCRYFVESNGVVFPNVGFFTWIIGDVGLYSWIALLIPIILAIINKRKSDRS